MVLVRWCRIMVIHSEWFVDLNTNLIWAYQFGILHLMHDWHATFDTTLNIFELPRFILYFCWSTFGPVFVLNDFSTHWAWSWRYSGSEPPLTVGLSCFFEEGTQPSDFHMESQRKLRACQVANNDLWVSSQWSGVRDAWPADPQGISICICVRA